MSREQIMKLLETELDKAGLWQKESWKSAQQPHLDELRDQIMASVEQQVPFVALS